MALEQYVALRAQNVEARDADGNRSTIALKIGDVIPDGVEFREPRIFVEAGWIAPYRASSKPGRPAKSVDIPPARLADPIPDNQATATAGNDPAPEAAAPAEPVNWSEAVVAANTGAVPADTPVVTGAVSPVIENPAAGTPAA